MRNLTPLLVLVLVGCGDGTVGSGGRTPPGRGRPGPGQCVEFEPYPGYFTCLLSLPQDNTPPVSGEVSPGIGGATGALLRDRPPSPLPMRFSMRDESLDGCLRVHDQGRCGWCVPHAVTGALEALYCSKCGQTPDVSPTHLRYVGEGSRDFTECSSGWDTGDAMQTYVDNDIVSLEEWPYVDNAGSMNGTRPDAAGLGRGRYGAAGVGSVSPSDLSAIKSQLATGRPVVIAVPVHQSNGWGTGGITQVDAGKCTCGATGCSDSNCIRGYHAVVLTGYDDATMQFTFLNSWGRDWGSDGFGTMPYDFVTRHASSAKYYTDVKNADVDGCMMMDAGPRPDGSSGDAGPGGGTGSTRCAFTDCNTCGRAAGCGWCAATGRCMTTGSTCTGGTLTTSPERCDLSMDPCHSETACDACLARRGEGCGWCSRSGECITVRDNPSYCGYVWTEPFLCTSCTGDCMTCIGNTNCGWCANSSSCMLAYGSEPALPDDTSSCGTDSTRDFRTGMGAMCPMPDAGPGGGDSGPGGGRDSGPGGDRCAMGGDCTACNDIAGCGYCNGTGACMSDTRRSECPTTEWRDSRGSCADCSAHAACRECIFDGNCGWCNTTGSCLTAGPGGVPLTPCADFNYTNPDMCM